MKTSNFDELLETLQQELSVLNEKDSDALKGGFKIFGWDTQAYGLGGTSGFLLTCVVGISIIALNIHEATPSMRKKIVVNTPPGRPTEVTHK